MAITTYAELKTALETYTGRADSGFVALVPDFISQAENFINRKINWNPGITEVSVSLSQGSDTAALPAGFLEIIDMKYPSNDFLMEQLPLSKLLGLHDDNEIRPYYYAVADTFRFEGPSDATYTLDCNYYKKWDIATDGTNALLTQYEDLYLDMSLWRAYKWMRSPEEAATNFSTASAILADVNHTYGRNKKNAVSTVDSALLTNNKNAFNIFNGY